MALANHNVIGGIEVISIMGQPVYPQKKVVPYSRTGVDSHVLAVTGRRGTPFQLVSIRDYLDQQTAHQEFHANYKTQIGGDLIEITWHGEELLELHNCKFAVLDVIQADLHAIIGTVGGLVANSKALVAAQWTLLAIEVEVEEVEDP